MTSWIAVYNPTPGGLARRSAGPGATFNVSTKWPSRRRQERSGAPGHAGLRPARPRRLQGRGTRRRDRVGISGAEGGRSDVGLRAKHSTCLWATTIGETNGVRRSAEPCGAEAARPASASNTQLSASRCSRRRSAVFGPTTAATSSGDAARRALSEPKRRSSVCLRLGPMPGISSSTDSRKRF